MWAYRPTKKCSERCGRLYFARYCRGTPPLHGGSARSSWPAAFQSSWGHRITPCPLPRRSVPGLDKSLDHLLPEPMRVFESVYLHLTLKQYPWKVKQDLPANCLNSFWTRFGIACIDWLPIAHILPAETCGRHHLLLWCRYPTRMLQSSSTSQTQNHGCKTSAQNSI